jgi:hypothetical protein
VTETTGSKSAVSERRSVSGWFVVLSASVLLMLGGLAGGYLYGRELASHPLANAVAVLEKLEPANKHLQAQVAAQTAKIASLEAKLKNVQTAMDTMSPAKNTYKIGPNQAVLAADGRLTIGLVGAPANQSVAININGKQHIAVSGDVIDAAPDPSTKCQVKVLSFDMFSATLAATCAAVKSH